MMGQMVVDCRRYRITVQQFEQMRRSGAFGPDDRVDLVEGVLLSYAPPHGPLHAGAVRGIPDIIREQLRQRAILWPQLPVVISHETELEPDLAVLVAHEHGYRTMLPRVADVHATVEIADSSLHDDRTRKLRIYASAGIPEYWIVDVKRKRIEVFREARGVEYASYRLAQCGDTVAFRAFPDVAFSVDDLLG